MLQYKLINKIRLATTSLIFISGVSFADSIGDIVESTGIGQIVRNNESIQVSGDVIPIELNDEARTGNGRMMIEFKDEAQLSLKEHSEVLIDEIYYDPDPSLSKMSMKFTMGTARFASGRLGLINKANIDISTPTASIAVRGTDFTATVDELGRSLIILLPDDQGRPSGEIIVSNKGGVVTLNQSYSATMVSSVDTKPTQSITLNGITPSAIDNMFIVAPPPEVKQRIKESLANDLDTDKGLLDDDFLKFDELERDVLAEQTRDDFTELDIDELDIEYLVDVLEVIDSENLYDTLGEFDLVGAKRGFNEQSQYNIFLQDGSLVLYRNVSGKIRITIGAGGNFTLNTITPTWDGVITGNDGVSISIYINQVN
jgi:hypothetical protein|tara:strand:- start:3413 stop:4525 length:1113 start_codon:yes stop_codon:yes gene_type:complete